MVEPSIEQIRSFRLRAHHLDAEYGATEAPLLVGVCGMQNSPPGAWETALFNRAPSTTLSDIEKLLYQDKSLIQAWSMRGALHIFPTVMAPQPLMHSKVGSGHHVSKPAPLEHS